MPHASMMSFVLCFLLGVASGYCELECEALSLESSGVCVPPATCDLAALCCAAPLSGPWRLGLYREDFLPANAPERFFGALGLSINEMYCDGQRFSNFKLRFPYQNEALSDSHAPISCVQQSTFSRTMGYVEWDSAVVNVPLPNEQAIVMVECESEASIRVGSPLTVGTRIRVPFILQFSICSNQECRVGLNHSLGVADSSESLNISADVRFWVHSKEGWLDSPSTFLAMNQVLNEQLFTPLGLYFNSTDPFAVCDSPFAQCLSLPNGPESFDIEAPDALWVLSEPGTMDHLPTTARAVDMVLGPITHVALLLQSVDLSILAGSLTLDTIPAVLIAVGAGHVRVTVKGPPNQLRAFIGTNSNVTLAPDTLPILKYFSGSLPAGTLWPDMANVETLQITNPTIVYPTSWDWETSSQKRRHDLACTYQMQEFYSIMKLNASCMVANSDCPAGTFCLRQNSWPSLHNLIIMGIPFELHACFQGVSNLTQLTIDGSPMTNFTIPTGSSLSQLRLTHNINLAKINGRVSITQLALFGNPKLVMPTFNQIDTALVGIDFSFSKMFISSALPMVFYSLQTFICVGCSLKKVPDFQKFAPNVSHVDLSRNQITLQLRDWVNTTAYIALAQRLCFLNMSDNAVGGPFPVNYRALILGGCKNGEEQHLNFDHNLVEAYSSPSRYVNGDVQAWLDKFEIFPSSFVNDVASRSTAVPGNVQIPWLSFENNRLKGNVSRTLFNSVLINIRVNSWWCDDSLESWCGMMYQLPVVSVGVVYGEVTGAQYDEATSSPFWPYSISSQDKQTIVVSYYSRMPEQQSLDWMLSQRVVWRKTNSSTNLMTIATYLTAGSQDCLSASSYIRLPGQPTQTYACRILVTGKFNTDASDMAFTSNVWLVNGCGYGRGAVLYQGCQPCPKNTYSEWCANCLSPSMDLNTAASFNNTCSSCPSSPQGVPSITVTAGAITLPQCVCDIGAYGQPASFEEEVPTSRCRLCDVAAVCVKANETDPEAAAGWFKDPVTKVLTLCDPSKACEKGKCTKGYDPQFKCSACMDQFYRVNRECKPCYSAAELLLVLLAIFLLFALLFLLKVSKTDYTKLFTISISLGYVQIISIFAAFPVTWPNTTQDMLNFLSFFNFNFDLASPECAVKTSFWNKWLMKLLLPLIACGVLYVWYLLVRFSPCLQNLWVRFVTKPPGIDRCLLTIMLGKNSKRLLESRALIERENSPVNPRQLEMEWEREHLANRFITAAITLATIGYTFVAKTTTQPFNCLKASDLEDAHMRADPSVICYDEQWMQWLPVVIFFVLFYMVGIPLTFFTILVRAHRKKTLRDPQFLSRYGRLVLPFRERFWFWELVQLARKLTTVLLIDFKADTTDTTTFGQISGVLLVLILFFVLQEFVRPYEFTWCNRLEFAWTGLSLIILVAALVFSFDGALSTSQLNAYAVFLILALVGAFFMTIYTLLLEKRRVLMRVGLGSATYDKIEDEHQILDTVFGSDLGDSVYRKTRAMSPEMHDKFFSKVSVLAPLHKTTEMTKTLLESNDFGSLGNPSVFPSAIDTNDVETSPEKAAEHSRVVEGPYSSYSPGPIVSIQKETADGYSSYSPGLAVSAQGETPANGYSSYSPGPIVTSQKEATVDGYSSYSPVLNTQGETTADGYSSYSSAPTANTRDETVSKPDVHPSC